MEKIIGLSKPAETAVLNADYSCSFPSQYLIEPTNKCNLKCPFCVNGLEEQESFPERGSMSLRNYKIILQKIAPYAKLIYFYNWGEPFLNKDINEMVKLAADRGIVTHISSNLSLQDIDCNAIVRSGLTVLVVSIDGACQETYGKYKVGGNYKIVMRNIDNIQKAKKRMNKDTPAVYWQFLTNKFNEHEVETAKKAAKSIGIPIYFNKMMVFNSSWESSASDTSKDPECLITSDPAKYKSAERSLPLPLKDIIFHPDLFNVCRQVINLMVINWDGNVFPCTCIYNKAAVLANVVDQSLDEVWNGGGLKKCRKYLYNYSKKQVPSPVCGTIPCFPDPDHPLMKKNRLKT